MSQDDKDRSNQDARSDADAMERARKDLADGNYVGKGMTSPDSTQVPLSAETGEPDERAIRGDRNAQGGQSRDRQEGASGDQSGREGNDRR
jgi:hypothetical protein